LKFEMSLRADVLRRRGNLPLMSKIDLLDIAHQHAYLQLVQATTSLNPDIN
jgi:hypothetical protein